MIVFLLSLFLVLPVSLLFILSGLKAQIFTEQIQEVTKSVVMIEVKGTQMIGIKKNYASGVLISPDGLILTNAHAIDPLHPKDDEQIVYKVILPSREELPANLLAYNKKQDLALLKIEAKTQAVKWLGMKSDEEVIISGTEIFLISSPNWIPHITTFGHIASCPRYINEKFPYHYFIDVTIMKGCSGGGVFNQKGELIGILKGMLTQERGGVLGIAIPPSVITDFIEKDEKKIKELK